MKKNILIIILGLVVIGFGVYYLLGNNPKLSLENNDPSATTTLVAEESQAEGDAEIVVPNIPEGDREPSRYACVGEYCDGSMSGDNYLEEYTVLKIPFIRDGGQIGCGVDIFYGYDHIAKTSAVLKATYERLFDIKEFPEIVEDGFRNTVGAFRKTFFDKVTLSNGLAKVYLYGSIVSPGTCADPEFKAQIEAAAFQFSNVESLEVYLNGKIFDWCTLDMSDGEGACGQGSKLWITNK